MLLYQSTAYIICKLKKKCTKYEPMVKVLVCLAMHSQTTKTGGGASMFFLLHSVEVVML